MPKGISNDSNDMLLDMIARRLLSSRYEDIEISEFERRKADREMNKLLKAMQKKNPSD